MNPLMNRWLAIVLFACANVTAVAQQGDRTNQPPSQRKQVGQQQSEASQQPGSGAINQYQLNQLIDPYTGTRTESSGANQFPAVNYNWVPAGSGGVWDLTFTDLNAEINLTPADDALRAHLRLPKDQGLIVTALAANAPAAQAGIEQNDVLLRLGDTPLAKAEDLEDGLKTAGEKPTSLTILRGGKRLTIHVQPRVRVTMGPVQPGTPAFWIGISLSPLEPALRSQLKLQNRGLLAIDVAKDSPAAQADVKVHDILLSLDGKPFDSPEKLVELVQSSGEKSVPLELIREGKTQTILVTPRRRKPSQDPSVVPTPHNFLTYQLVRPGAVLNVDPNYQAVPSGVGILRVNPDGVWIADVTGRTDLKVANEPHHTEPKVPADLTASLKRLDDLDAEIKQLRKAIEELNKILKDKK